MTQAPNTVEMDEHFKEVVHALLSAVNFAMPHTKDPEMGEQADQAIRDCKEILDTIMEGKVSEWLDS